MPWNQKTNEYQFLELVARPIWIGQRMPMNANVSTDQGLTYHMQTEQKIFGTFFFVAEERKVHSRDAFTYADLFSKVGGLTSLLNIVFISIASLMNMQAILASIVERIFYYEKDFQSYSKMNLSLWDHFYVYYPFRFFLQRCKKPNRLQKQYILGAQKVKKDLDIVYLIRRIRKLSAGFASIMDKKQVSKARRLYYKDLALCEGYHTHGENPFLDFINLEDSDFDQEYIESELHQNEFKKILGTESDIQLTDHGVTQLREEDISYKKAKTSVNHSINIL